MELPNITFAGPKLEDGSPALDLLPDNLVTLLREINGFILFSGGLHVRGLCVEPMWHSLASVLIGEQSLQRLYPVLARSDIPFGQDCVADQYILRDGDVFKLQAETGQMESLGVGLSDFFSAVRANPVEYLGMQPLLKFQQDGGSLEPGQVLHVYPPFCTKEAASGVSLKAVSVQEAIAFLAAFAKQTAGFAEGTKFRVSITP